MYIVLAHLTVFLASTVVWNLWSVRRLKDSLHLLQLDGYSNTRLFKWLLHLPRERLFALPISLVIAALFLAAILLPDWLVLLLLVIWVSLGSYLFIKTPVAAQKKPLVYTARAKRILLVAILLDVLITCSLFLTLRSSLKCEADTSIFTVFLVSILASPLLVVLANIFLIPIQKSINFYYLASAKKKLLSVSPVIIGITGSYGKTSTKYFLTKILSERFSVLMTPGSFNTLLGISSVINKELKPHHRIFIAEIGAYVRGDVTEKCKFLNPSIGILTTIGPEHFERFKTMENIVRTNYELIESLPGKGLAVMNAENEYTIKLIDETSNCKVVRFGLEDSVVEKEKLRVTARNITTSPQGLSFEVEDLLTKKSLLATCRILGRHNIANILAGASVGLEMGLTLEEVVRGIAKIEAAPHRLQLLSRPGGVTIIDDAYNSNPVGAEEALKALGEFKTGKKILITPGMVELGELEEEKNREFGKQAAGVCDHVILVGVNQTKPILQGLQARNFPADRLFVCQDLNEAIVQMNKLVVAGDVVLFENDLPDQYNEKKVAV